ncbi:evolutionarily conserved signaling intermediate in Toll pathway, mitochondrial [Aplysia californica]|uniref:Evolutionarily conserved signaling intermediate in Toll pathway, mitochondrial n=1 Tax=Aplysia californica TaxID=6500 RepID=A0ABM0JD92_APLCA|nr:evolutionarily conserved signaling intermediate in Toll pathway, mitochondrial [Aplysia californica]XP_005091036.1 evolutionarily conserved signaling intermediate in Toll pathway, mitochondrial [Aplysia californica]
MYSPITALVRRQLNFNELSLCLSVCRKYASKSKYSYRKLIESTPPSRQTYSCIRGLHVSLRPSQKEVPSQKNELQEQKQEPELVAKEAKDLEVKLRVPAPRSQQEEWKSSIPDHDPGRITGVGEKLERKALSIFDDEANTRGRNKEAFLVAVSKYISKETLYRRGAVEFVYAGLQEMKTFGVVRDLASYKALLQAFPKGKMIPRNAWQVEFMHYPRQQQCAIDMLEQMEVNAVIPDDEFGVLLKDRFGNEAHATRKYRRIMYWLPKFKNMNPYPVPFDLPENDEELALIALRRMCVDKETRYTVWKTAEEELECEEDTFVASAQSPTQQELLRKHKSEQPVFVEGPYPVYLRTHRLQYFLLRAEPNINALMKQMQLEKEAENDENLFEWTNFFEEEDCRELQPVLSVHEQEDSTVLALAVTGSSSKTSLVSWVRLLQRSNPSLARTPVLFKLLSSDRELEVIGDNRAFKDFDSS